WLNQSTFCGWKSKGRGQGPATFVPTFLAVISSSREPAATCARDLSVSSLLYGNRESDLWRQLFLGSGRNLSQIKRCYRHGGRLCRWHQRQSNLRRRLHG